MVCEEGLSVHEQRTPFTPRLESHWFVEWCLQTIGANETAVKDRLEDPWLVLLWIGPIHWLRGIALVCSHTCPWYMPHSSVLDTAGKGKRFCAENGSKSVASFQSFGVKVSLNMHACFPIYGWAAVNRNHPGTLKVIRDIIYQR
jgi:hypothetical protein